ncbi:MAG: DUF3822 family protein [Ginsengibacter sp.]
MKTLFEILPSSIDSENSTLICELSNEGVSFVLKNEEENSFLGVAVYQFDKSRPQAGYSIALQILFHQKEWLTKKFNKTFIIYSTPESVLVPFSLYDSAQNEAVLNLVHGDLHSQETILSDLITEQQVYNIFRIPTQIYNAVQNQFFNVKSVHQYSRILKQKAPEKDKLAVIFYTQKMVISLFKEGKYHLINSFTFRTAEEVSYIILDIRQQFDVNDIDIEMSGLIEENSALYKEIYKYFTNISFYDNPKGCSYPTELSDYPAHYFSHIFALDPCE